MKQGEIWYAGLEPAKGSEQGGKRQVVIVSGTAMNISFRDSYGMPLNKRD